MPRSTGSVKAELVRQSREAALNAVQTFNNPLVGFKSQTFIVLMIIAWTYLLHAYYRQEKVEYRYVARVIGNRRRFERTKHGTVKYWDLEKCLNAPQCPLNEATKSNLRFLIGLRHRIEHEMAIGLDCEMSDRYQACALNYCHYVGELFGDRQRIEHLLSYSLQFSNFSEEQIKGTPIGNCLPSGLRAFIKEFDAGLPDEIFNSSHFAARIHLERRNANRRNQADVVATFIDANEEMEDSSTNGTLVFKDRERKKLKTKHIVRLMGDEGFPRFKPHHHIDLWKAKNARDPSFGYGVWIDDVWFWYESWLPVVRQHCSESGDAYR